MHVTSVFRGLGMTVATNKFPRTDYYGMSSKPPDSSNRTTRGGHFTEALLLKAHSPETASQIFTDKIKSHVLNLNPTQPSDVADGRAQRRRQREKKKALQRKSRKPKPLTAKEKRKSRIYEIPRECRRYEIYEPLHRLWIGYAQDVLFGEAGMLPRVSGDGHAEKGKALMVGQDLAARFMSADLHGSHMKVVRSRCPSRVGVKGIMVKETKMTFEIITKGNELKSEHRPVHVEEFYPNSCTEIPKEHSIFEVEVPPKVPDEGDTIVGEVKNLVFQIHGTNFMYRAAERGHKKFKAKPTWDI